jgi:hypothetical protein
LAEQSPGVNIHRREHSFENDDLASIEVIGSSGEKLGG